MSYNPSLWRILADLPAKTPALMFPEYGNALAGIIRDSEPPQFAIGIFGGWGSGKTTLMNCVQGELGQDAVCVNFSAWRYEKERHVIIPLLATIGQTLGEWRKDETADPVAVNARQTASTVGKVISALASGLSIEFSVPGLGGINLDGGKALEEARRLSEQSRDGAPRDGSEIPTSLYRSCFETLTKAFDEFRQTPNAPRIVVFVDDLDRCRPEGALEVLESIKLFFDFEGFIFVVGLDRAIVERCIDLRYSNGDRALPDVEPIATPAPLIRGADYIKKIFQVPFNLPPVALSQLRPLINGITSEGKLPPEQIRDIEERVSRHLNYLFETSGSDTATRDSGGQPSQPLAVNPREVKRFINSYVIQMKIQPTLDADVCLALNTLSLRQDWEPAEEALRAYGGEFLVQLRRLENDENALADLDETLAIPQSFLEYVRRGPGSKLLTVENVDQYIFALGRTEHEGVSGLMELLRNVTGLKGLVRTTLSGQTEMSFRDSGASSQNSPVLEKIQTTMGIAEKSASYIGSERLSDVFEKLESLRQLFQGTTAPDRDSALAIVGDVQRVLREMKRRQAAGL